MYMKNKKIVNRPIVDTHLIDYFTNKKVKTHFSTNGPFLDSEEVAEKIVDSGLCTLRISLDGASPRTKTHFLEKSVVLCRLNVFILREDDINYFTPKEVLWTWK